MRNAELTREKILKMAESLVFENGFSGTSVSDIVQGAGVTKGAFFHHFDDKAALAHALVDRWAQADFDIFRGFADQAAALADDPLREVLLFLKLFEEWADGLDEQLPGCMFASYAYERSQFTPEVRAFIADGLDEWMTLYQDKFEKLLAARAPAIPGVTARDLTDLAAAIIEGGFILSRVYGDQNRLINQSKQLRNYLTLLFPESATHAGAAG